MKMIPVLLGGIAAALILSPQAQADNNFVMCPDGHEGVVGANTSCAFAANVRKEFYLLGMTRNFTAVSPITGQSYAMDCGGVVPAHFVDGQTLNAIRCYGGNNAEVVVW